LQPFHFSGSAWSICLDSESTPETPPLHNHTRHVALQLIFVIFHFLSFTDFGVS
jgi:hypothetical protein